MHVTHIKYLFKIYIFCYSLLFQTYSTFIKVVDSPLVIKAIADQNTGFSVGIEQELFLDPATYSYDPDETNIMENRRKRKKRRKRRSTDDESRDVSNCFDENV